MGKAISPSPWIVANARAPSARAQPACAPWSPGCPLALVTNPQCAATWAPGGTGLRCQRWWGWQRAEGDSALRTQRSKGLIKTLKMAPRSPGVGVPGGEPGLSRAPCYFLTGGAAWPNPLPPTPWQGSQLQSGAKGGKGPDHPHPGLTQRGRLSSGVSLSPGSHCLFLNTRYGKGQHMVPHQLEQQPSSQGAGASKPFPSQCLFLLIPVEFPWLRPPPWAEAPPDRRLTA